MLKKLFCILLIILVITGCASNKSDSNTNKSTTEALLGQDTPTEIKYLDKTYSSSNQTVTNIKKEIGVAYDGLTEYKAYEIRDISIEKAIAIEILLHSNAKTYTKYFKFEK